MNNSSRDPYCLLTKKSPTSGPRRLFQVLAFLILLALPRAASAQGPKATDFGFKNQEAKGQRGLLVILIEDPKMKPLAHNAQRYDNLLFSNGSRHFLTRYIAAMSGSRFGYYRAGVVGPYSVSLKDKKGNFRASADIRADAIRAAAAKDIDFSKFDANKDKIISTSELTILLIDNGADTGGQTDGGRDVELAAQKVRVQSRVSGVAHRESLMTMCHELLHTIGGLDIYGWPERGQINQRLTLFGPTTFGLDGTETFYLDPWHRMQFGWVEPQIRDMRVDGSLELRVPQLVENVPTTPPSPLILFDAQKGAKEFFILEYRNGAAGPKVNYDTDAPSSGLSIWHVQHGADKKPFLMNYEVKPDPTKQVWTLYNRGAPDWNQGGNRLYTQQDGEIALRWMDRGDSGIRVKVNSPAKGDNLSVSWSLTLKRTGAAVVNGPDGNLDAVVHEGNELFPYFMVPGKPWIRVAVPITKKATGPGAIAVNKNRNFEVVAIEGKDLVHYWAVPGKPYNRGAVITNKASGPGSIICNSNGNLDVLAQEGNEIVLYYYFKGKWNRGFIITNKATGPAAIAQERNGNLNAVVLEGKELVHYWAVPGKPYNRGSVLTNKATGPGSIAASSAGILSVVVQEGNNLAHYWAKEGQAFKFGSIINNKTTTVGIGAICQSRNGNLDLLLIEGNQLVHYWAAPGKGFNRASAF